MAELVIVRTLHRSYSTDIDFQENDVKVEADLRLRRSFIKYRVVSFGRSLQNLERVTGVGVSGI